jgi:hypothetical protein
VFLIIDKVSPIALADFFPGMMFVRKETAASVVRALSMTDQLNFPSPYLVCKAPAL